MTKKLSIKLVSAVDVPPKISHKVAAYFEQFVLEKILQPFGIIINSKPDILLAFTIMETGTRIPDKVNVLKAQSVNGDKLYTVIIPAGKLLADNNMSGIVELFYEAISLFFTENYRKVTPEFLSALKEDIDMNYLLSIPFPAPEEDVLYIGK